MSVDALTAPMATTDPGDGHRAGAPRQLERGTQFGRFVVVAPLGAGGAGTVYAAYDPELDRRVALKLLHAGESQGDERDSDDPLRSEWPRLVREARALAKLSHPNVVVVHDIGIEHGRAWLATELVDGSDLLQWLAVRRGLATDDILAPFIDAGRGLAAAHAAGLVHGDFKPANVLVGADGRARVADFGLARMQARTEGRSEAAERIEIVGTPYYMAPEQLVGIEADARADQYAFCLSLLEAVAGRRAYDSSSVASLFVAKQERMRDEMFERVPMWLAKILTRGLARAPEDRHASMDALLGAIAAAQTRRSQRRIGLGLAGAIALGAGVTYLGLGSDDAACEGSTRHVDAVWDAARRDAIGTAFAAAQPALGPAIAGRVHTALDAFADAWVEGHRNACLAVHHGEQRTEVVDARTRCLDDRLGRLGALVELFVDADTDTVVHADAAIAALPEIAGCADADLVLRQFGRGEDDPTVVEALAVHLRKIDAAFFVARYDRAQASIDEAVAVATTERGRHALGVRRGNWLRQTGRLVEAERELEAAILGAVSLGDDATALVGLVPIIQVIGNAQLRWSDAQAWERWREPLVVRSDASPTVRADLLAAAATIDAGLHQDAAALDKLDRARALLVESGATAVEIAIIDVEIGQVLRGGPDLAAAEARIEQGREVIARELGEQHPDHAEALGELGIVKLMRGDPAAGRELLERSLALLRATYGVEHPAIAPALNNLAVLEGEVGNYARARALLLESLDVERKRYGDDNLVTAPTLVNLASAALWMDEPKLALVELEKAETIFRAADPERPELAGVYRQKSYALGELGRATEAVADAVRAVELFDKHRSADDPRRADARTQLGAARLLAGDRDGANVAYDEAVAILERGAARSPAITAMLASTLEARAEVHAAAGDGAAAEADRTRAKSLTIPAGTPVRSQ